jgi:hypothetical protein
VLARYTGHGPSRIIVEGNRRGTPVQYTSNVDFPDRDRQNPFVARLWAAQRVGFLSADKRKNGGGTEVDEEIRMLGERYGIPTEFTSYLVTEPQFAANRRAMSPGSPIQLQQVITTGASADARSARFESAKTASAQRSLSSVGVMDSISAAAAPSASAGPSAVTRTLNGRTFILHDGVWTDIRYTAAMTTTKIKPFSKAYFDLIDQVPELRAVFSMGTRLIVVGRDRAVALSDDGVAELSSSALAALAKAW